MHHVNGSVPNLIHPNMSITTLFHDNKFKNTSDDLPQNLLDKYDRGAITLPEMVCELFEPWETVVNHSTEPPCIALQIALEGIP